MTTENHLVLGYGEVGQALESVLEERNHVYVHDPPKGYDVVHAKLEFDWAHVCYPWHEGFVETTLAYLKAFKVKKIMIHSTVPVGTTRRVVMQSEAPAVYSPIRGMHPRMRRYLLEFPKWYACPHEQDAGVAALFARNGMHGTKAPSYEALEWMKLWETSSYAVSLAMWQEIERQADSYDVRGGASKPEVLSALKSWLFEKRKVYDGDRGVVPIYDLVPGPIGGHCVSQNWELLRLSGVMNPTFWRWLNDSNEKRKDEK